MIVRIPDCVRYLLIIVLHFCLLSANLAHGAGVLIDHQCVDLSALSDTDIARAASLRLLMRHASVGQGINWGLDGLAGLHPTNPACTGFAPGKYDRANWVLELRGGNWSQKVDDLVEQTISRTDDFDVFMMKFCYIDALGDNHPDWEYFRSRMEQLEADFPGKRFVWWTIPLTRDGQPGTDAFNELVRSYCLSNDKILFDIADIECHDTDGTKLTNAQGNEVISQNYTKEIHAGHLNVEARILVASALWRLMAAIAEDPNISDTSDGAFTIFTPTVLYVDADAVGTNDGTSWNNAYTFLQDALADAEAAVKPVEIRVAQGIYKPDQGIAVTLGDWRASFHLKSGVTVTGGYAGFSAPDPNARDVGEYETILSGDLYGNDVYINDPNYLLNERTRAENSWTVVIGNNTDETAILDGFTITSGYIRIITFGLGGEPAGGAGMIISSGSPTIINCTFTDNITGNTGGGLLIYDGSNPTLLNCKFIRNYAESGGGGIFSSESGPTLINCKFYNNYARRKGGAMFNFRSNPELTDCTFSGNSIPDIPTSLNEGGGAMRNSDSNLVLNKCVLSNNTASYGAGMYNENNSSLTLKNCTFRNNLAGISGGGMFTEDSNDLRLIDCCFSGNSAKHSGGGMANKYSNVVLVNCIFSGNKAFDELRTDPPNILPSKGGGLYTFGNIKLINCTNCTFTGNWAQQGRAIAKSGTSDFGLTNCILWDGGNEIFDIIPNRINIDTSYSNIQNIVEGKCNINEDPLFANPGYWADADDPNVAVEPNNPNAVWIDGDYHLKSQAGRWDPNSQSWIQDDVTSPCIDAGDPNSPIGHEPFPNGGIINMGAYGGTEEASMSISTEDDVARFAIMKLHRPEDNSP